MTHNQGLHINITKLRKIPEFRSYKAFNTSDLKAFVNDIHRKHKSPEYIQVLKIIFGS
jgi:hypothetical protein